MWRTFLAVFTALAVSMLAVFCAVLAATLADEAASAAGKLRLRSDVAR
jgi:hypothetical protein